MSKAINDGLSNGVIAGRSAEKGVVAATVHVHTFEVPAETETGYETARFTVKMTKPVKVEFVLDYAGIMDLHDALYKSSGAARDHAEAIRNAREYAMKDQSLRQSIFEDVVAHLGATELAQKLGVKEDKLLATLGITVPADETQAA